MNVFRTATTKSLHSTPGIIILWYTRFPLKPHWKRQSLMFSNNKYEVKKLVIFVVCNIRTWKFLKSAENKWNIAFNVYINLKAINGPEQKICTMSGYAYVLSDYFYSFGLSTEAAILEGLVQILHTPQPVGQNQMSTVEHRPLSGKIII